MSNRTIQRVRHETRRRVLEVKRVENLTPYMKRVIVGGDDLEGFVSAGFDDHVKLFVPAAGAERPVFAAPEGTPAGGPAPSPMRDYTPRRYDAARREMTLDFALHDSGPATAWAASAQPGQFLGVGGPRGSFVIPVDFDWHLLVGDETALPAIGRRLEELPAGSRALVVAEVRGKAEELPFETKAQLETVWVHRNDKSANGEAPLLQAVRATGFAGGDYYAWVACEASLAKQLRQHLVSERGTSKEWIKAAAYWRRGDIAIHERIED